MFIIATFYVLYMGKKKLGLVALSCNPATREARSWDGLRMAGLTSPFGGWINLRPLGL